MNRLNNKGFTLVELIATVIILSLVITIGVVSITTIINKAKEKDYELLIKEIKNAVEEQYIECKFANNSSIDCPKEKSDGFYRITLQELVNNGFLKGNSTYTEGDENQKNTFTIVNPKNNALIDECVIEYKYENGNIIVEAVEPKGSCPKNY